MARPVWLKKALLPCAVAVTAVMMQAASASAGTWENKIIADWGSMSGYISHGSSSNTGCSYAKVNSTQYQYLHDGDANDGYGVVGYLMYTDCATGKIKHQVIGEAHYGGDVQLSTSPVYNAKLPRFMLCKSSTDGGKWIDCRT
ncbi:hypothetical protein [Streptomyces sp. SAS_270]|uniref:hypothetical protein n=1 Tax=Streptomyces sp. SAS_270 TaxID=3412748 RepID=UPI00403D2C81